MKKIVIFSLLVLALSGCSVGRRAFYNIKYKTVRLPTGNMIPTVNPGDYAAIDQTYYATNPVQRYDIVILRNPQPSEILHGADAVIIERVIGLGGEKVEIRGGKVFINQQEVTQPFPIIPNDSSENFGPIIVPKDEYLLLADNRPESIDSRHWNKPTVNKSYFQAKVIEILPKGK